jgi:hypothetical protein
VASDYGIGQNIQSVMSPESLPTRPAAAPADEKSASNRNAGFIRQRMGESCCCRLKPAFLAKDSGDVAKRMDTGGYLLRNECEFSQTEFRALNP